MGRKEENNAIIIEKESEKYVNYLRIRLISTPFSLARRSPR